ncbi:PucR family transcriptional regulator ligand-binding domain-containing protein [Microbacterium elymi]|uniref:PucR family transcriptional regulator ligand-binding domain-containing protein n=2 Tax=Microbacterium elymi TaxID=2909587 RepID=A0ABY5NLF0_9MICO|nr:PucR family transcriptional regulator ligand-binding domain-containing protein [Microbacterium elymi]UUT35972.1 PucR family transcriptional regulator ligand-binding domain-containing protein [Microbacterium elymi]
MSVERALPSPETDRPGPRAERSDAGLPTVREILALPSLVEGVPEVLVGEDGLDARVRWAHVSDSAGVARLLERGELLSTGSGWPQDPAALDAFIAELVDAGVAGLVLELGAHYRWTPAVIIDAARRHGLVLAVLDREVKFVSVTEVVHRLIIDRQTAALRARDEVRDRFTALILRGSPADYVVQRSPSPWMRRSCWRTSATMWSPPRSRPRWSTSCSRTGSAVRGQPTAAMPRTGGWWCRSRRAAPAGATCSPCRGRRIPPADSACCSRARSPSPSGGSLTGRSTNGSDRRVADCWTACCPDASRAPRAPPPAWPPPVCPSRAACCMASSSRGRWSPRSAWMPRPGRSGDALSPDPRRRMWPVRPPASCSRCRPGARSATPPRSRSERRRPTARIASSCRWGRRRPDWMPRWSRCRRRSIWPATGCGASAAARNCGAPTTGPSCAWSPPSATTIGCSSTESGCWRP